MKNLNWFVGSLLLLVFSSPAFAQPANDNFADAILITSELTTGSNVDATKEVGEPLTVAWPGHARSALGGKSVWYKWVAPSSRRFTVKTGDRSNPSASSDFDTQVGIYDGTALSNLKEVASNESNANFANGQSYVEFNAVKDRTYYILVDGKDGQTGNIFLYVVPTRYPLVIDTNPSALGSVSAEFAPESADGLPTQTSDGFLAGSLLTLTATPNGGETFYGWTGINAGKTNPLVFKVLGPRTITANFAIDGQLIWQRNNHDVAGWLLNDTNLLSAVYFGTNAARLVAVGDLNGDGSGDFLFQSTNGSVSVWAMEGDSIGSSGEIATVTNGWRIVGVGHFNSDTNADILLQNVEGRLAVWLMNGFEKTGAAGVGLAGSGWRAITAADFDNDSDADILFQHTDGRVAVWIMNGTTRSSVALLGRSTWRLVTAKDFNDDGSVDLLFQSSDQHLALWLMNGTTRSQVFVMREGRPVHDGWRAVGLR